MLTERGDDCAEVLGIARHATPFFGNQFRREGGDVAPLRAAPLPFVDWTRRSRRRLERTPAFDFAHRGGELVAAAGDRDDERWTLRVRFDLTPEAYDLHVDATVESLGVAPVSELHQLIPRQHPSRALRQGLQQAELAVREHNVVPAGARQAVAAEVEPKTFEFQQRLVGLPLRGGCERFGHAREQLGFIGAVHEIMRSRALAAGGRDDENPADRGPQFFERDAFASVEPFGADDRQRKPLEAGAAGMREALGDLGAIAVPARETRQATPQFRIPSDHHDPVAHRNAISVAPDHSPFKGVVTSLLHGGDRDATSSAHLIRSAGIASGASVDARSMALSARVTFVRR